MGLWRWRYLIAVAAVGVAVAIVPLLQPDRVNNDEHVRFQVQDREYVLESAERFSFRPDAPLYLSFSGDWMSLDAECSTAFSEYKVVNGELILPNKSWRETPCTGELALRIRSLNIFFRHPPNIAVDGDRVTLSRGSMRLTFLDRRVANIGVLLDDRVWRVTRLLTSTWDTGKLDENLPSLRLFDGDKFQIHTGCRMGKGNYQITGNQMTFSKIAYDAPSVEPPSRLCTELQRVLREGAAAYRVDGRTLRIARDTVTFTAETE